MKEKIKPTQEHVFDDEAEANDFLLKHGFAIRKERRGVEYVWIVTSVVTENATTN